MPKVNVSVSIIVKQPFISCYRAANVQDRFLEYSLKVVPGFI